MPILSCAMDRSHCQSAFRVGLGEALGNGEQGLIGGERVGEVAGLGARRQSVLRVGQVALPISHFRGRPWRGARQWRGRSDRQRARRGGCPGLGARRRYFLCAMDRLLCQSAFPGSALARRSRRRGRSDRLASAAGRSPWSNEHDADPFLRDGQVALPIGISGSALARRSVTARKAR